MKPEFKRFFYKWFGAFGNYGPVQDLDGMSKETGVQYIIASGSSGAYKFGKFNKLFAVKCQELARSEFSKDNSQFTFVTIRVEVWHSSRGWTPKRIFKLVHRFRTVCQRGQSKRKRPSHGKIGRWQRRNHRPMWRYPSIR